jgi:hypothetical protein
MAVLRCCHCTGLGVQKRATENMSQAGYAVCRRGFEVALSEQSRLDRTCCSSVRSVLFNDDLLIGYIL